MPIGTYGAVKTLLPEELIGAGSSILLANTYHLFLRPGTEIIESAGGLHAFMGWDGPILTDSGGFQVFSLAQLRRISDDGVTFRSELDGSEHFMGPEESIEVQRILGTDIVMAFDECPPGDASREMIEQAVRRTTAWTARAARAMKSTPSSRNSGEHFFPIVQGGVSEELRKESWEGVATYVRTGVAIGGLAVGEPKGAMFDTVSFLDSLLPKERLRYLMGVGKPEDLVAAVARGVDLFDCVLPTRSGRNGQLFTSTGAINIRNERHKRDFSPVDESCPCILCRRFTRAYLRHLFQLKEILGLRLASLHNLTFYLGLMRSMREAIAQEKFVAWSRRFLDLVRHTGESA